MTAANNPNFNPEKYTTIASNHLVVYSIHTLYKDGDEIRAEDIISACFMLFPKKFSLRTYPQWPDSALVGRRLHDCEKSGWLTARIETGFKLTAKGTRLAERVAKELGIAIPKKEKPKQVHKLQVDKLRVTEVVKLAPKAKTTVQVQKQVAEVKVARAVKPVPAVKPAPAKPKIEKAIKKQVAEVKVTEAVKPRAKTTVHRPPSIVQVQKRVDKLRVTEAVKPAPITKPPVVETPKPVEKKTATTAVKSVPVKVKPAKKAKAPVVKAPKPVEKKTAAPVAKATPVKPIPAAKAKAPVVKMPKPVKKTAAPIFKPEPVKSKVEKAKTTVQVQKRVDEVKVAKAVKPEPAAKPRAKVIPPPTVPRQLSLLPTISAEEKARAGKFVKMMEGSDAYRLYKKNGANANIGEFDFRSLLLCTMESSHETLARNVDLFKGYAEMHNRQDLVAFLTFCRGKFAHLLTSEKKAVRKLK